MTITCTHQLAAGAAGLCETCQYDYDVDPGAYMEFGEHPDGQANWAALLAEMEAERQQYLELAGAPTLPVDDDSIPF